METSNIIGGSNIYPCKGSPLSDQEFVNHIEDYRHIRTIRKMQESRQSSVTLTKKQSQLVEIEMKCALLRRPDPCWGYIKGQGVRSRCIEGRCPQILKCNPTYKPEDTVYWTMTEETKASYGNPDKQKKYYLVDLVFDGEMLKYISDPKGAGIVFPPMKEPEQNSKKDESEQKDRRLVIIGYEETYFGDADNQLSPIWGYVDDSEDSGPLVTHRYGSRKEIVHEKAVKKDVPKKVKSKPQAMVSKPVEEVKVEEPKIGKKPVQELAADKKAEYESNVKSKLDGEYKLTEVTGDIIAELAEGKVLSVILANEAECAYVSSMLQQAEISHDVETTSGNSKVYLWRSDSKNIVIKGNAVVSGEFVRQGCDLSKEKAWAELQGAEKLTQLIVTGRDFFSFVTEGTNERWGCRNFYGATHIAVRLEDFILKEKISREQKITLMKDEKNYIVLATSNAEQLGISSEALWNALDSLKMSDEISEFPRVISGLILSETGNGIEIKGIGHMKFDEY